VAEETRLYYKRGHNCKFRPRVYPKSEVNPKCNHLGRFTATFVMNFKSYIYTLMFTEIEQQPNSLTVDDNDEGSTTSHQQTITDVSQCHLDARDEIDAASVVEEAVNSSNARELHNESHQEPNLSLGESEFVYKVAKEQSEINTLQKLKEDIVDGIERVVEQMSEAQSDLVKKRKEVEEVDLAKTSLLEEIGSIMSEATKDPSVDHNEYHGTNEESREDILIQELSSWSINDSDNDTDESIIHGTYSSDNCFEEEGIVFRNNTLKVGIEYFKGIEIIEVDSLPSGIDGKKVYKMTWKNYSDDDRRSDGRNWHKAYDTTPYNFNTMCDSQCNGKNRRRRIQKCMGEYRCTNENCTYLHSYKTSNFSQYKRRPGVKLNQFFCKSCGEEMSLVDCEDENLPKDQPPRRYISICSTCKVVGLYYMGIHSCQPKAKLAVVDKELLENNFRANPRLTPLQAQRNLVIQAVHNSADVSTTYDSFSDLQAIERIRRRVKRDEITDAIHLIAKIDQSLNDKYLIRQVKGMNNEDILYLTSNYKLSRLEDVIRSKDDDTRLPNALSIDGNFSLIRNHCILGITVFDMSIARIISVGEIVIKLDDGKGGETGTAFTNHK
jgi:hypothetical protein